MIIGRSIISAGSVFVLSLFLISCGGGGSSSVVAGSDTGGSKTTIAAGNEALVDGDDSAVVDDGNDTTGSNDNSGDSDNGGGSDNTGSNDNGGGGDTIGSNDNGNNTDGDTDGDSDGDPDDVDPEPPEPPKVPFEELMANSAEADAFGVVIDSPVSGLRYKSGDHYGITDSAGKYGYIQGQSVEFFVGDITIGSAITPLPRVTPYELANSDPRIALHIARFLQTLDNDANPDNGIQINDAVHALAAGATLDFSNPAWQGMALGFEIVDGKWVAKQSELELLVSELTSATEAGARELVSTDTAMSHLSVMLHQIIISLGAEAESVLSASTCETDSQCKWTQLSDIPSYCGLGPKRLVYSEVDADLPSFESLEAQRVYLIEVRERLKYSAWGPDQTRGSCTTTSSPTWAVCGESNHCEITNKMPMMD